MTVIVDGSLRKMSVENKESVQYQFRFLANAANIKESGEKSDFQYSPINELIGKRLQLSFSGNIYCVNCGRHTKKSFSQGYCYVCFRNLPENDTCIMSPEKCHFHLGTCRDESWAQSHCFQPHVVYLSNTSTIKVGITRIDQVPIRWMDQGAVQAIPIALVGSRRTSGAIEDIFKAIFSDKTSWQAMLKSKPNEIDMFAQRDKAIEYFEDNFSREDYLKNNEMPIEDITLLKDKIEDKAKANLANGKLKDEIYHFNYPVEEYPLKVKSFNAEKQPLIEGTLQGIKGQYLLFDNGVINIRKYSGYQATISVM